MIKYHLLLLVILNAGLCMGQSGLHFRNFSVMDGLSDSEITCIAEDNRGFIWVGTSNGLNRFDGHRWMVFRKGDDEKGVCGNVITNLVATADGFLWIGTADGGVCRLNTDQLQFNTFPIFNQDVLNRHVFSMAAWSGDSAIIDIDKESTYYYNATDQMFFHLPFKRPDYLSRFQFMAPLNGSLLLAPIGKGLWQLNGSNLFPIHTDSLSFPYPGHTFRTIHKTAKGDIWLGAWDNGLYRYREGMGLTRVATILHQPLSYSGEEITSISSVENQLWMGTKSSGLLIYDTESRVFQQHQNSFFHRNSLVSNVVKVIFKSSDGLVWIGTDQGISLFDPRFSLFSTIYPEAPPAIPDLNMRITGFAISDNDLFISTQKSIYRRVPGRNENFQRIPFPIAPDEMIYSLFASDANELLAGTNKTAYILKAPGRQPEKFRGSFIQGEKGMIYLNFFDLESSRIVAFARCNINGIDLFLASVFGHGIGFFNPTTKVGFINYLTIENGFENLIEGFFVDSSHRLWMYGQTKGLLLFKDDLNDETYQRVLSNSVDCQGHCFTGTYQLLHAASFLQHSNAPLSVVGMIENKDSTFFLATRDKGLVHFNPGSDLVFKPIPQIPYRLEGIARDGEGRLWLSAGGSLILYDPESGRAITFTNQSGLPERGVQGKISALPNGTVLAGSFGGFVRFDPGKIRFPEEKPRIAITHFNVMNQSKDSLLRLPRIKLPYTQNFFSVQFTGYDFSGMNQTRYAYQLQGINDDWVYSGVNPEAIYTSLVGGKYIFRVKSINAAGIESDEAILYITIIPTLWKRAWFQASLAVLMLLLTLGFYRFRILEISKITNMRLQAEIEAQEKERKRLAQDLHDELGTRLSALKLYMGSMKNYLLKTSEAREINENASFLLDESVKDLRDLLNNLSPDSVSRYGFFKALGNLVAMINNSKALKAGLQITGATFRFSQELALYRIVQELINNSLKHSGCSRIDISILCEGGQIDLLYEDNGKGMDMQNQPMGLGFRNINSRLALMNGSVTWDSTPGKGFRAVIRIIAKTKETI